jgi:NADPH2:quinone reductase
MLAAFYERPGAARDVLQLATLPDPQPQAGEVRVRMRWSGVNPSDVKSRAGSRGPALPFPRIIPHSDGMGVIEAVGPGVATTRIGKRVWTWNAAWNRPGGTAAQFTCLPAEQAVTLPDDAPDEAGACLGIPALTALHAVLTDGGVAGQRVLVAAGAGAVGHYAVQFAKLLGARQVLATASTPAKQALAREAGADFVTDYRAAGAAEYLRSATQGQGVDRIVEMDIAANAALNLAVMRPGATWAVYGSGAREFQLAFFPLIAQEALLRFFIVYNLQPADRARAEELLTDFLARGLLQHNIAERVPLRDIVRAHELVESGAATGNVVVQID